MRGSKWITTKALATSLLLLTTFAVLGADPTTTPVKDPPGTELYMGQFRQLFDRWDLDKDGYLDKDELAKAFRGPNAKAYDYVAPAKSPGDKTDEKKPDEAKPDEKKPDDKKPDDKKDPAKTDSESTKDPKKPDYSKLADYNFLIQLDTDGDGKISKDEFMIWARDVSTQMRDQAALQQQALLAQQQAALAQATLQRLANKQNSSEYKKAAAALRKEQSQLNKLNTQITNCESKLATAQQIKMLSPKK